MTSDAVPVERMTVSAYRVPTDRDEADGTLEWQATTLVLVQIRGGGCTGLGWTYTHRAAADLIADTLVPLVCGGDGFDIPALWQRMNRAIRNIGRPGLGLMAIAAIDHALWDLKARVLNIALVDLFGRCREAVPIYGSGGFTSYTPEQLAAQLGGWVEQGIPRVKMKVGTHPDRDAERVRIARGAIGAPTALMVDGNGVYRRKQALALAAQFAEQGVVWFEEPVSSDDLEGLRLLRDGCPAGMAIAAGEYGWDAWYFRRMLAAGAVDVLQADTTRCGGFTGFLQVDALCRGYGIPLSAHCAPALHMQVCSAATNVEHIEYFHDHVRIERLAFDGVPEPREGALGVDRARPGMGYAFRERDMERYRI